MAATVFSDAIKDQIREASGRKCSAPFCRDQLTFYHHGVVVLGEIAHVYGHGAGSARSHFLPVGMDPHGYNNGISLCRVCHRMIDRCPELFPAEVIFEWKGQAEFENSVQSMALPTSTVSGAYQLRLELPIADDFMKLFNPFITFMDEIYFYGHGRNPYESLVQVRREVINSIREGAEAVNQRRDGVYRYFFQHPPFRNWMAEIVRACRLVRNMEEFGFNFENQNVVNLHFKRVPIDGVDELVFSYPTARAMRELHLLIGRFQRHLSDIPWVGMPANLGF